MSSFSTSQKWMSSSPLTTQHTGSSSLDESSLSTSKSDVTSSPPEETTGDQSPSSVSRIQHLNSKTFVTPSETITTAMIRSNLGIHSISSTSRQIAHSTTANMGSTPFSSQSPFSSSSVWSAQAPSITQPPPPSSPRSRLVRP